MRNLLAIGASFVIAGCVGLPEDEPVGSTVQAVANVPPGHCPDPLDCTVSNGGGVYSEEGGHVGFGTHDFMIERFENRVLLNTPYVGWVGRYAASPGHYGDTNGVIRFAQYAGGPDRLTFHTYNVTSITESFTQLTVNLVDPNNPTVPIAVSGSNLSNLRLVLTTPIAGEDTFTLYFGTANAQPPIYAYGSTHTVERYGLVAYAGEYPYEHLDTPYCKHADGSADYSVFQQGIQVDPLDARTQFGVESSVTLSCMGGAIATARWWGYPYRNIGTDYQTLFEAAMHLKRASYCGDITYYTQAGTNITLNDAAHIHVSTGFTSSTVEARWGRAADGTIRALCVNQLNERHRGLHFPPTETGLPFNGDCYSDVDGSVAFQIPACSSSISGVIADMP